MALNFAQKDALTTSDPFLARVRQALRQVAVYYRDTESEGSARKIWSSWALAQHRVPRMAADLAGEAVEDPAIGGNAVQPDASDVTDASLKAAVEAICLKYTGA